MKSLIRIVLACGIFLSVSAYATNAPTIGTVTSNIIQKGTGDNYIIVNGITDGDASLIQNITVTALSSNDAVLSVTGVMYTQGQSFAIIKVKEFGIDGMANVTLTATDIDGITSKSFDINVGFLYDEGCRWSIYDIVFWQNVFPSENTPSKLDSIIPRVELPTNEDIWKNLGMTVGFTPPPGNGTKAATGYTTSYQGTIVPSLTGVYMFTMAYQDGGEFRISKSANYDEAFKTGGFLKSSSSYVMTDTVHLVAGRPYGYKCAYWTVFTENFALRYAYLGPTPMNVTTVTLFEIQTSEGVVTGTLFGTNLSIPGFRLNNPVAGSINFTTVGSNLDMLTYPYYDLISPNSVSGLTLLRKTKDLFSIKWNPTTDVSNTLSGKGSGLKNYKVYVDGVARFSTADDKQTSYSITSLTENTSYSVYVTAVDKAGNESMISDVIYDNTFNLETDVPTPPSNLTVDILGDMSAKISWSPSIDNTTGTGIYGYKIYVNGALYNKDTLNATTIVLKTFQPLTNLSVTAVAIDGNYNVSALSTVLGFTTLAYDPLSASPEIKKLRMSITKDYNGKIDGIGLNTNKSFDASYMIQVKKINPGLVRWGTLDANAISYNSASAGSQTYAKFIDHANKADAAAAITIGTDGNPVIDWRDETLVDVMFGTTVKRMTISERTAQQMISYLFAPDEMADKNEPGSEFFPYHADVKKRLNENFSQPNLTGSNSPFKPMIIEFGNEVWGGTSNGAPGEVDHNANGFTDYKVYGLWARRLARAFKSSPYYDSTKIKLAYSLRYPLPSESFGLTKAILETTDDPLDVDMGDILAPSGYLDGNFLDGSAAGTYESELDYYKNKTQYMSNNLSGFVLTQNLDNTERQKRRPFFLYESAFSSPVYNQRMGQAILLTDYFLSSHEFGSYYPGLFSFEGGEWGITQSNFTIFNPMYKSAQLINNVTKGNKDVLVNTISTIEYVRNEKNEVISVAGSNMKPVSTHIYHKKGIYSLVLISRDFENDFQVQVKFPAGMLLSPATSGRMYVFTTSGNFSAITSNVSNVAATISNEMIVTVPKFGMVVYTFAGEVLPENRQQLGYSKNAIPTGLNLTFENASNPSIPLVTEQFGSIIYKATAVGGVAATKAVGWKVLKPDTIQTLDFQYEGITLRINTVDCRSNGVLTITSYLINEPNIFQTSILTVAGIITDGLSSCPAFGGIIPERIIGGKVTVNGVVTITSPVTIIGAGTYTATTTISGIITVLGTTYTEISVTGIDGLTTTTSIIKTTTGTSFYSPITITSTLFSNGVSTTTGNEFISSTPGSVFEIITSVSRTVSDYFKGFTIQPNPSYGQVLVKSEYKGSLRITNSQGSLMNLYDINELENDYTLRLEPGMYFFTFSNNIASITKKVIIVK